MSKGTSAPNKAPNGVIHFIKANTAVAIILGAGVVAALTIAGALAFSSNNKPVAVNKPTNNTAKKQDAMNNDKAGNTANDQSSTPSTTSTDTNATGTGDVAVTNPTNIASSDVNVTPSTANVETVSATPSNNSDNNSNSGSTDDGNGSTAPVTPPTTPPTPPATPPATPPTPPATPPTPPPADPTNLIANGDVEADGTTPTGWSFAVDNAQTSATSGYLNENGNHYLRTSVTALGGDYPGAQWATSTATPVTGGTQYKYSESYRGTSNSEIDAEYTHLVNGVATTEFLTVLDQVGPAADWTTYSGVIEAPADATSVTVYHVLNTVGTLDTDNFALSVLASVPVGNGMVSLTFDDGWTGIHTNAYPTLKALGLPSTQFLISDTLVNNDNYGGDYMTTADAADFLTIPGSEIGDHTVHHCDLTGAQTDDATNCPLNITEAQIQSELNDSKSMLESLLGVTVTDFASPYGATNPSVINDIKAAGYLSHRSVADGYNVGGSFNPYNIKVKNICGEAVAGVCDHATTAQDVQDWLTYAQTNKVWLVIVFHDVNAASPDPSYSVTPTVFDQMMTEVNTARTNGLAVKSMSDALAAMPAN